MTHLAEHPTAVFTPEEAVARLDEALAHLALADGTLTQAKEALGAALEGESSRKLADAQAGLTLAQRRQEQAEQACQEAEATAARLVAELARDIGRRGLNRERRARVEFLESVGKLTPAGSVELARALGNIRSHDELAAHRIEPLVRRWRAEDEVAKAGPRRALEALRDIEGTIP